MGCCKHLSPLLTNTDIAFINSINSPNARVHSHTTNTHIHTHTYTHTHTHTHTHNRMKFRLISHTKPLGGSMKSQHFSS